MKRAKPKRVHLKEVLGQMVMELRPIIARVEEMDAALAIIAMHIARNKALSPEEREALVEYVGHEQLELPLDGDEASSEDSED